jgi:preprotein translocase subunit SecD
MKQRYISLVFIIILVAVCAWIVQPNNPGIKLGDFQRTLKTTLGLDLQGGMQVLLEADVPATTEVNQDSLADARTILESRSNGLGVSEVVFQVAGTRRIVGEFPGLKNPEDVIAVLKQTGQLEFVDMGDTVLKPGTIIKTDHGATAPTTSITPTAAPAAAAPDAGQEKPEEKVWHTVMTGDQISKVAVTNDDFGKFVVTFELKTDGAKVFGDYTTANIGKILAIVMDKAIISTPSIQSAITEGKGEITGNFNVDSANALAIQLRYGSLPVPLKVIESRVVGPTLGQDSLKKSYTAGIIGFVIVALFMLLYYRMPGAVAVVTIAQYALLTLAIYKLLPVTLTLPGSAGFLLSTGGALDANILIFERMKEELRAGRTLGQAVELGWKRAWPSIRDSNVSTLITSLILFWFASSYGATVVKGFALTLALGVAISLFTSLFVTRTFLSVVHDFFKPTNRSFWYGI